MSILNNLLELIKSLFFSNVEPSFRLSRFLTSKKSHFSIKNGYVKSAAFMPMYNKVKNRYETSVFQVDNLSNKIIQNMGAKYITGKSGKEVYGYARISHQSIETTGLSVNPDNKPPRHANVCGWPERKDEQKLYAIKLSQASKLVIFN